MHRLPTYQKEVLEKGKAKPVNLVHGEEEFLIKALLERIRSIYGDGLSVAWGDELSLENLYELGLEGSMFSKGGERAVFVLNSEPFLNKVSRKKAQLDAFRSFLSRLSKTKLFFVVNRKLSASELSKEPFKTVSSLGDVILADRLPTEKVKEIVRKKLEREAGGIEEGALDLLVELCQGNLMVLKWETEKLIAYSDGEKITEDTVRKVCVPWESYGMFEFLDRFFERDVKGSLRILKDMYRGGVLPLQIVSTLSSYAIKLFTLHLLLEKGEDLEKALDTVGVKHKFARLKFKRYLDKVPKERARKLVEGLYRLDFAIKVRFSNPERSLMRFTEDFTVF